MNSPAPCTHFPAVPVFADVMHGGHVLPLCQECYERLTMTAFVKIDYNVFVAQDTRDILLAEIARLEAENARLTARMDDLSAAFSGFQKGKLSQETWEIICANTLFPATVIPEDVKWASEKLSALKAQGQGANGRA